jgi:K+/H+ antiporter YhaU regulatory subunit KhtT
MDVPGDAAGKSLKESGFRKRYEWQVIAVQKVSGELVTAPDPEYVLAKEDTLIVFKEPQGGHA